MASSPVLVHPNFKKPFVLFTNTSDFSVGGFSPRLTRTKLTFSSRNTARLSPMIKETTASLKECTFCPVSHQKSSTSCMAIVLPLSHIIPPYSGYSRLRITMGVSINGLSRYITMTFQLYTGLAPYTRTPKGLASASYYISGTQKR